MSTAAIKAGDMENSASGQAISKQGQSVYGTLDPAATAEATAPQGINPSDMAKINTSAMQTAGGANAGAVGQGSLLAARTHNAGTADAAIAKSGETASENLSKANLGAQIQNQSVKQQQQKQGFGELNDIYGTATSGLNASNAALKNAATAPIPWWEGALNRSINTPWGGVGQIQGTGGSSG